MAGYVDAQTLVHSCLGDFPIRDPDGGVVLATMSELESLREQVKDLEARLLHGKTAVESAQADLARLKAPVDDRNLADALEVFEREVNLGLNSTKIMGRILAAAYRSERAARIETENRCTHTTYVPSISDMIQKGRMQEWIDRAEKAERELEEARKEINRLVAAIAEHLNVRCDYQRQVQAKDAEISKLNAEVLRLMEEVERLDQDGGNTGQLKENKLLGDRDSLEALVQDLKSENVKLKAENDCLHLDPNERAMYNEALAAEHNEVEKFKEIERKRANQVSQLVTEIHSLSYVVGELRKALEHQHDTMPGCACCFGLEKSCDIQRALSIPIPARAEAVLKVIEAVRKSDPTYLSPIVLDALAALDGETKP